MGDAPYRIEPDEAPRDASGVVGYRIHRGEQLIARYWHDHRGDEHEIDFVDGTREQWPLGRVTDVIAGGGPEPLRLTSGAIAYLERWARRHVKERERVQFFGATCEACRRAFAMPLLSDQSYGEFILQGEHGEIFGYLSALDEPWEEIRERCRAAGLALSREQPDREAIAVLHRVIAACADPIAGQRLVPDVICPSCGSRDVAYGTGDPRRAGWIPVVRFSAYLSLSDDARSRRVAELLQRAKA